MEVGRPQERATVLAIWYLGKDYVPNSKGHGEFKFGIWEG